MGWVTTKIEPRISEPPKPVGDNGGYPANPYLFYRPIFARSLPIQIFFTGITLTLVCVLLVQLTFTAPYHFRLARTNFILQVSAAISVLVWEATSIVIIINETRRQSQKWPFMLEYVAIDFPPLNDPNSPGNWSTVSLIFWFLMNALVSALTQMTHIQFLSLMYPSHLEAQLIFILLGPLSIIAALTQFAPLHADLNFVLAAGAVRNVCNATLSILFTVSLLFWGFFVNRHQAWRTDGGTATFGVGAILFALLSTALTVAYIPSRDQFEWVPGLIGVIVLWQSFLGWWWWVGAGMGISEVDEWLNRAENRRKRRAAREASKKGPRGRLRGAWNTVTGGSARERGVTTAMENAPCDVTAMAGVTGPDSNSLRGSTRSVDMTTTTTMTTTTGGGQEHGSSEVGGGRFWPLSLMRNTFRYVRNAHVSAARTRALERVEHIREVFGYDGASPTEVSPTTSGWGLGSFGAREREGGCHGTSSTQGPAFEMEEGTRWLVRRGREAGVEDDDEGNGDGEATTMRTRRRRVEGPHRPSEPPAKPPSSSSSMWWWGPLRRWRLQDATEYSER